MTVRLPCSVSLPYGFRYRRSTGAPLVHRRNPRRPLRSVPPRLCLRVPVRSARGWSRSSSRIGSPATGRLCTPAPSIARLSSKPRMTSSRLCFDSASSNSSGVSLRRLPRPLPRPPTRPDWARRRHGHAGSSAASRGRDAGIILIFRRSPRITSFRPTGASAPGVVNPSPTSRAPRIPKSWRSRSGPIAESSVGVVIGPPAAVVLIPAWSPPRRRLG